MSVSAALSTNEDHLVAFPHFKTHNFEGWIRQFRSLAKLTGDSDIIFDAVEDLIPLKAAVHHKV